MKFGARLTACSTRGFVAINASSRSDDEYRPSEYLLRFCVWNRSAAQTIWPEDGICSTVVFYGLREFRWKTGQSLAKRHRPQTKDLSAFAVICKAVKSCAKAPFQITNQLLYQLSYAGILGAERQYSARTFRADKLILDRITG